MVNRQKTSNPFLESGGKKRINTKGNQVTIMLSHLWKLIKVQKKGPTQNSWGNRTDKTTYSRDSLFVYTIWKQNASLTEQGEKTEQAKNIVRKSCMHQKQKNDPQGLQTINCSNVFTGFEDNHKHDNTFVASIVVEDCSTQSTPTFLPFKAKKAVICN